MVPIWLSKCSPKDIEQMVKELPPPVFVKVSKSADQDFRDLPNFAEAFDEISTLIGTLPTQDLYAGYYLKICVDKNIIGHTTPDIYQRARRNYPSFIREYHLYTLLKRHFKKEDVIYNRTWDQRGIDFVIRKNDTMLGIKAFINTSKSWTKFGIKETYRHSQINIPTVNVVVDEKTAKVVNGYWLYQDSHVSLVEKKWEECLRMEEMRNHD